MTSQVTQCPSCKTSFRVTEAQLSIANGAVRCGACLHIFNAADHWLPASHQPPQSSPVSATAPDPLDEALIDDTREQNAIDSFAADNELLISDDMELDLDEDDQAFLESSDNDLIEQQLFIDDDEPQENNDEDLLDLNILPDDEGMIFRDLDDIGEEEQQSNENWARQLLDDDSDQPDRPASTASASLQDAILNEPLNPGSDRRHREQDFSFADLIDAGEEAPNPPAESPEEPGDIDPDLLNILGETASDQQLEQEFILGNEPLVAGERIGHDRAQLLASIEPEPFEFSAGEKPRGWRHHLLLSALLLALLGLPGQYLVYQFDTLARDDRYRPLLAQLCPLLGCVLPPQYDLGQIRSSNLIVRSHPAVGNALVVDAIITNTADFSQPFPALELQFSDLAGNIVAGRQFQPSEYLAGEATGLTDMPSRQPVHVGIAIVDPGQQAVNYQLRFHPAN